MTLRSVAVVVLATLLISSTVVPAVALGTSTTAGSTTTSTSELDDWRLEITTREDPYRTGANNTTRWVNGTVSLIDSEAVDIVTVTLNGDENESFEVPVEKPGTIADGEFNFTITLEKRVNHVTVRGFPTNNTTISDTLVLDGDVLPDTYERDVLGTAPDDPDSDSSETAANEADDGVIDGAEDFDGDELRAIDERRLGTDPLSVDTDDDGLRDGIEARYPEISPTSLDGNNDATPDRLGDLDGDGVDNLAEQEAGTFLHLADTDNDGIPDAEEIDGPTDPTSFDTDGDGISDGVELAHGTDPTSADSDGDGVLDVNETLTTVAENATLDTTVEITGTGPVATVTTARNATRERFNTSVVRAARVGPVRRIEAGVNFSEATVTVGYDESAVPNSNESDLVLYRQNETLNTFVPLETDVDTSTDQLSATIHQDSTVVAMAQSVWQGKFPEQPPEFGREITFEDYNESDCRPGCEVENGTVTYGNSSKTSNSSSVDEDGPRIDDKDGGEETTTEQDVVGGFQEPESRSLPTSTGDSFEAELQKPEHDYAEEPLTLTVVHNRNESDIISYEWYYYNDLRVEEYDGKVHTDSFRYNDSYNLSVLVTTTSGETDWANLSKPATTHGKTPNTWIEGPTKAKIDGDTTYYAPNERYGSRTEAFEWLVDGQHVENDACNGCVGSRYFEHDFQTEGYHTVTHIQNFENGDSVTKEVEVYVESTDPGVDDGVPSVNLDGPRTATVGESVSYSVDASDDGEIVNYNWSVRRPDNRWFNGIGDSGTTYGGKLTRPGEYVVEVAVTDNQNQTTTDQISLTVDSDSQSATNPPTVDLRGPSYATEGDNVSYRAEASDEDGIQSYDWRIQRPNGYWYNPANDDSDTYGGVIDSGVYTIEVTVTDEAGELTTVRETVLSFSADTGLLTKHTRDIGQPIAVQSGTESTVVEARVRGEVSEGYAKLVAVGESGTTEVFSVSASGAGEKDWRTVEAELADFDGETVTLRSEWTSGAEVQVDNVRVTRDWDGDGLSNNREKEGLPYGNGRKAYTNPYNNDTDDDGLADKAESGKFYDPVYLFRSNPARFDSDGDGLDDYEETKAWDSAPLEADTDEDGYSDFVDPEQTESNLPVELEIRSQDYEGYVELYVSKESGPVPEVEITGSAYYEDCGWRPNKVRNQGKTDPGYSQDRYRVRISDCRYENPERYYINVTDPDGRMIGMNVVPADESAEFETTKGVFSAGATAAAAVVATPADEVAVGGAGLSAGAAAPAAATVAAASGVVLVGAITYDAYTAETGSAQREVVARELPPLPLSEPVREAYQPANTPLNEPIKFPSGERYIPAPDSINDRGHGWELIKKAPGIDQQEDVGEVLRAPGSTVYDNDDVSIIIGEDRGGDDISLRLAELEQSFLLLSASQTVPDYNEEDIIITGGTTGGTKHILERDNWDHNKLGDTVSEVESNVERVLEQPDEVYALEGSSNEEKFYLREIDIEGDSVIVYIVTATNNQGVREVISGYISAGDADTGSDYEEVYDREEVVQNLIKSLEGEAEEEEDLKKIEEFTEIIAEFDEGEIIE